MNFAHQKEQQAFCRSMSAHGNVATENAKAFSFQFHQIVSACGFQTLHSAGIFCNGNIFRRNIRSQAFYFVGSVGIAEDNETKKKRWSRYPINVGRQFMLKRQTKRHQGVPRQIFDQFMFNMAITELLGKKRKKKEEGKAFKLHANQKIDLPSRRRLYVVWPQRRTTWNSRYYSSAFVSNTESLIQWKQWKCRLTYCGAMSHSSQKIEVQA